ncbi:MAG TPA: divergent polysaccharide deacetylase family protein [Epsilonproteobacteria bacterium]|nr:divergent polysaccharide deacetylase family protein [Campylobacterota bacterium]
MATKPKKSGKKSSSKKTVSKKKISKKTSAKKKTLLKKNIVIVVAVFFIIVLVALGYFIGKNDRLPLSEKSKEKEHYSTKALLDDLAQLKVKKPKKTVHKTVQKEALKKSIQRVPEDVKKEKKSIQKKDKKKNTIALAYRGKKPRLVIIIDDVHTKEQIAAIKKLELKITPSIFPPYVLSRQSNLLAKQVRHYMIHLPMESGSKQFNRQTKTLMTSFTDEQIADRVMELRKLFPHAKYINNHTGSVFTSNYKAMKKLYIALKLEGFVFVDSFTVASSKVNRIAHELGDVYVRRDIFIDNKHTIPYIHHQLTLAVAKAKKKGYAIAIGHPHKTTMKALASAKQILKDVELVYIDDIYRRK